MVGGSCPAAAISILSFTCPETPCKPWITHFTPYCAECRLLYAGCA